MIFYYAGLIFLTVLALGFIAHPFLRSTPKKYAVCFILCVFVITVAWSGYEFSSSKRSYLNYLALQKAVAVAKAGGEWSDPQKVVASLKETLRNRPNDAQGWYLLAKIYFDWGDIPSAYPAAKKAYELAPNHPQVQILFAQLDYSFHEQKISEQGRQALKNLLLNDPDNMNGLNLMAWIAYHDKNYADAMDYWKRILPQLNPQSPDYVLVTQMIKKAEAALMDKAKPQKAKP